MRTLIAVIVLDANGILNVSAIKKSTNKENKITISNDKGRLSKEDIERMLNEAEKYRNEDEKYRNENEKYRNEDETALESHCLNMKSTMEDDQLNDKISESDKQTILDKCNEAIKWLDQNQLAEKEEHEHKQKELKGVCNPIITKLQGAGGAGLTIEEVD